MSEWKEDLLTDLLRCGYADLSVLEDCQYPMWDLIEHCDFHGMKVNLNSLARAMFEIGLRDIQEAINDRKEELECQGELTEDEKTEYAALQILDPYEDTDSFHNFLDTSIWFCKNRELYEKYMQDALEQFECNTGYSIE